MQTAMLTVSAAQIINDFLILYPPKKNDIAIIVVPGHLIIDQIIRSRQALLLRISFLLSWYSFESCLTELFLFIRRADYSSIPARSHYRSW